MLIQCPDKAKKFWHSIQLSVQVLINGANFGTVLQNVTYIHKIYVETSSPNELTQERLVMGKLLLQRHLQN